MRDGVLALFVAGLGGTLGSIFIDDNLNLKYSVLSISIAGVWASNTLAKNALAKIKEAIDIHNNDLKNELDLQWRAF